MKSLQSTSPGTVSNLFACCQIGNILTTLAPWQIGIWLRNMESVFKFASPGITLAQNFRATSRLRPGDLERCFNKQGDTRLHVAAVLAR